MRKQSSGTQTGRWSGKKRNESASSTTSEVAIEMTVKTLYDTNAGSLNEVQRTRLANAAGHYLGRLKQFREEQSRARK